MTPQSDFRCSRWPPQKQVASELDCIQRKMAATMLKVPLREGEPVVDFIRRRGRIAKASCDSHGLWSQRWFDRALRWDEHLARPRNCQGWAARLRSYHDRDWFIFRRSLFAPVTSSRESAASATAGRTGTRACRGKVHMRWHDGVEYARQNL